MEELICIESDIEYFVPGVLYTADHIGDHITYIYDYDGDDWGAVKLKNGLFVVNFIDEFATFTTASNQDARADDSEGGCRE